LNGATHQQQLFGNRADVNASDARPIKLGRNITESRAQLADFARWLSSLGS
jgi:hypothetical protein